jgi:hypothetical protein
MDPGRVFREASASLGENPWFWKEAGPWVSEIILARRGVSFDAITVQQRTGCANKELAYSIKFPLLLSSGAGNVDVASY